MNFLCSDLTEKIAQGPMHLTIARSPIQPHGGDLIGVQVLPVKEALFFFMASILRGRNFLNYVETSRKSHRTKWMPLLGANE